MPNEAQHNFILMRTKKMTKMDLKNAINTVTMYKVRITSDIIYSSRRLFSNCFKKQ